MERISLAPCTTSPSRPSGASVLILIFSGRNIIIAEERKRRVGDGDGFDCMQRQRYARCCDGRLINHSCCRWVARIDYNTNARGHNHSTGRARGQSCIQYNNSSSSQPFCHRHLRRPDTEIDHIINSNHLASLLLLLVVEDTEGGHAMHHPSWSANKIGVELFGK